MEQAKAAAHEDKVSINQILVAFIAEGLGHRRGLKMIKECGLTPQDLWMPKPDGRKPVQVRK